MASPWGLRILPKQKTSERQSCMVLGSSDRTIPATLPTTRGHFHKPFPREPFVGQCLWKLPAPHQAALHLDQSESLSNLARTIRSTLGCHRVTGRRGQGDLLVLRQSDTDVRAAVA